MFRNIYGHQRGTICVTRLEDGIPVALAVPQYDAAEWVGCYSIL